MPISNAILRLGGQAFAGLKRLGLFRDVISRRAFEFLYERYKLLIESRDVVRTFRLIRPGTTAVDIGANIGIITVPLARHVGQHGRVVAIEPDPANIVSLLQRVDAAGLKERVHLFSGVASNKIGQEQLVLTPLQPWDHHIGPGDTAVAATTIDKIVADLAGPPVSYVKIDVQGAEQLVIDGMRETLGGDRPAVCVEIHPPSLARFGTSLEQISAVMSSWGYGLHEIGRNGFKCTTVAEVSNQLSTREYVDVLYLPANDPKVR